MNPVPGYSISTPYKATTTNKGQWSLGWHTGADFKAPIGTPIVSATPGRVISANAYDKAYGYKVIIRWDKYDVWYCHMPKDAAKVKVGQTVKAGQRIGSVGNTGNTTGPHLHMELRRAGAGFAASSFVNPKKAIDYGVKPYGARWYKIGLINHGAAAGALARPGGQAHWRKRRKKLFDLQASVNCDVFVGLECGGGLTWQHVKKAYKNRGYKPASHVKGRAVWVRRDTEVIAKGYFTPPQRTKQKTSWKPAPWAITNQAGTPTLVVGMHLETASDSDTLRVQQAISIIRDAEAVARKHGLGKSQILFCADTASNDWVRKRAFNAEGYYDILEGAHKIVNAKYKSYNKYQAPVVGPRVDGIYAYGNPKQPTGKNGHRPVSVASQRPTVLTDHHLMAGVINRQKEG